MTELPTLDEIRHMRHAARPGQMFRNAHRTVVINPAPQAAANIAVAVHSPRRNAKAAVVEKLLTRGWLVEDANGAFSLTADGQAALDAAGAR